MKIQLSVSQERYEDIKAALEGHGINVDDDADLVLSERNRYLDNLTVRDRRDGSHIIVPVDEIILIETYGHHVEVHTEANTYRASDRLYKIASLLDPAEFLRISNSVIIAKKKVKRITPTLSMKFTLTMYGGRTVDVTRSYYYIFKDAFGI